MVTQGEPLNLYWNNNNSLNIYHVMGISFLTASSKPKTETLAVFVLHITVILDILLIKHGGQCLYIGPSAQ